MNPTISVIMPVYNGEKFLQQAIDSILSQTFADFEFIIVNDGSTDDTKQILEKNDDKRIIIIDNESNLGIIKSLNRGIQKARGKYIARMDADDISLPNRFQTQFDFLEKNKNIEACGTFMKVIDKDGKAQYSDWPYSFNSKENYIHFLFHNPLAHPSLMGKRELFLENPYEFQYAEDFELWERLSHKTILVNIEKVLLFYRIYGENISLKGENEVKNASCVLRKRILQGFGIDITEEKVKDLLFWENGDKFLLKEFDNILFTVSKNYDRDILKKNKKFISKHYVNRCVATSKKYALFYILNSQALKLYNCKFFAVSLFFKRAFIFIFKRLNATFAHLFPRQQNVLGFPYL